MGGSTQSLSASTEEALSMSNSRFPPGWSEAHVQRLLAHYEQQTEAQAVAEDGAAAERADQTLIQGTRDLVPLDDGERTSCIHQARA